MFALVKFKPVPPAFKDIKNTLLLFVLNSSTSFTLSFALVLPSKQLYDIFSSFNLLPITSSTFVNIEAIDNVNYSIDSISSIVSKGLNVAIIINIIIILVLFFATSYILNKKLNLE